VRARYDADVIVAETEYPFTNDDADSPPNLLRPDTFVVGYPATPRGSVTIWSI
jgi:arabinogalactan endo-1,4-beta-galactosidase